MPVSWTGPIYRNVGISGAKCAQLPVAAVLTFLQNDRHYRSVMIVTEVGDLRAFIAWKNTEFSRL
jgi:hypothetical protein